MATEQMPCVFRDLDCDQWSPRNRTGITDNVNIASLRLSLQISKRLFRFSPFPTFLTPSVDKLKSL